MPERVRSWQAMDEVNRERFLLTLRRVAPKRLQSLDKEVMDHLDAMNAYIAKLKERAAVLRRWEPLINYGKTRWERSPDSLNQMAEEEPDVKVFRFGDGDSIVPAEFAEFAVTASDFVLARTFQRWNVSKRPPLRLRVKLSIDWLDDGDAVEISATAPPLTLDGLNRVSSFISQQEGEK